MPPRRAKARDKNEKEIIDALRANNVRVYTLDQPIDLLCCKGPLWFCVEVKTPTGRVTPAQEAFFEAARYDKAPAYLARSAADVERIIREIGSRARQYDRALGDDYEN